MDRAGANDWLERYRRAWEERDPDLAVALFTDGATYAETPFDEPLRGRAAIREYWSAVPREQRDVRLARELVAVEGDLVVALWQAAYTRIADGGRNRLDGVFLLRFADGGLCRELREWWHSVGETAF